MATENPGSRARRELAFCEAVLRKGGLTVLTELFRDVPEIGAWDHYPAGDVHDPQSGAQWYYHCHPAEPGAIEHGHFHCFVRPDGPDGPIHHLVAIGVDAHGRPLRLFTVNRWVVDDDWIDHEAAISLLPRFDVHMPRPSYLVNRWLTAMFGAYHSEIEALLRERDRAIAAHDRQGEPSVLEDRNLEVLSEARISAIS